MTIVRPHTHCRVCDAELPAPYLDLGCQPLANALRPAGMLGMDDHGRLGPSNSHTFHHPAPGELTAPLAVTLCTQCGLSQLTVVVDPEVLYSGYRFRSGASREWELHCAELVKKLGSPGRFGGPPKRALDIASNDGTMLEMLRNVGWLIHGVDPSPCGAWGKESHYVTRGFWPCDVPGTFDLVVAQNVLGHVDRPVEFLKAVENVLTPDGLLIVEVPHVRDMIWNTAFDTIYHEHLSYWSTRSIIRAAHRANLTLHHSERLPDIHGGSRRYWFRRGVTPISDEPVYELPVFDLPYAKFANDTERRLTHVMRELEKIEQEGKVLGAYGASAKGAVMLSALKNRGNTVWPVSIVDDVKEKQGMLSPGVHIPIKSPEDSGMIEWDVCWCLSWNWSEQLEKRARDAGFRGEWLVTHPTVQRG